MSEEPQASLLVRILSLAFFGMLTLGAFVWFAVSIKGLISQFHIESLVVGFDKGSMYMLGCGLGLLLLTIGGLMQGFLEFDFTAKMRLLFARGIVVSLVLMVLFPQLTHYVAGRHAQNKGYSICEDASYRWLLYAKIYYAKSTAACNEFVKQKEITRGH